MRSILLAPILTGMFIFLGGVSIANAQLGQYSLRLDMPYEFVAENRLYPAGEYTISRLPGTREPATTLIMRGPRGKAIMLNTIPHVSIDGYRDTAVTLQRVDGLFYLSKIMIEGMLRGYEVPTSRYRRDRSARTIIIRPLV
ncbi:MAG TPA: hypothetical protein VJ781_11880 [Pyrinomonadaceae bacterium]|nr:hypothetical protein [Pyrinomonadaceae bacterium]